MSGKQITSCEATQAYWRIRTDLYNSREAPPGALIATRKIR